MDKADRIFILVRGMLGRYQIVGWIKGIDGMKDRYWSDPTHGERDTAWFVPAGRLELFETLDDIAKVLHGGYDDGGKV